MKIFKTDQANCNCILHTQKFYPAGEDTLVECQNCGNILVVPVVQPTDIAPVYDEPPFPIWTVALAAFSFAMGSAITFVMVRL